MPFVKGQSGNPDGRPKGTGNKVSGTVKNMIEALLTDNEQKIKEQFATLTGRDLIKAAIDLMPYVVPKLQSVANTINFDDLSDEQLDEIIKRLKGEE